MNTLDICDFDDLGACEARRFDVGGLRLCVVRIESEVYVIGDVCSHADISLAEGEVNCDDREIECWKHGSAFSLESGEPQTLPATQAVPVFEARVVDGRVVVIVS